MGDILNFINFKFEDLFKAKELRYDFLSTRRLTNAVERRQSRRSSRYQSLLQRRNITMESLTPEREVKEVPKKEKNVKKPVNIKVNDPKVNNRLELLKKWKKDREERLKKDKGKQKPAFKLGCSSNVGFSIDVSIADKNNYSFAPNNFQFKAPKNIQPLPMKLESLKTTEKATTSKFKTVSARIDTNLKTLTSKVMNAVSKPAPKITVNTKNNLMSKMTALKPEIKPVKPTQLKVVARRWGTRSPKTASPIQPRFNKLKAAPQPKRKVPKVIKIEEPGKVQFEPLLKAEEKEHITYKKTPKVSKTNEETIEDFKNKTPSRRSVRIQKILESEKNQNHCVVCEANCIDAKHRLANSVKRKKRKTDVISESDAIDDTDLKRTRNSTINKEDNEIKTPRRQTRKKTMEDNIGEPLATSSRRKTRRTTQLEKQKSKEEIKNIIDKKSRKSMLTEIEIEKENVEEDIKTPRRKSKKSMTKIPDEAGDGNEMKTTSKEESRTNKTPRKQPENNGTKPSIKEKSSTTKTPQKKSTETSSKRSSILKEINSNKSSKQISPSSLSCIDTTLSDSVFETPDHKTSSSVYVSPFVTTSRGKGSTKKENKKRKSLGCQPYASPENNSEEAGAMYFHNMLDKIIERLQDQCSVWEQYKETETISEDAIDMIDVAIGQTQLLINKKFQQFRNLIFNCQNKDGERPVTCADLQGFWDMVYMQVTNVDTRFQRLSDMRSNNWKEILPEVKKPAPVKKVKAKSQPVAKSSIKDAIRAARQKAKSQPKSSNLNTVFDGGFFVVKSPKKSLPNEKTPHKKTPSNRKSLLTSVLSSEAMKKSRQSCSPGLTMLKLSQSIKSIGKKNDLDQTVPTPGKSILKKQQSCKQNNISKVVLFKDESDFSDQENVN